MTSSDEPAAEDRPPFTVWVDADGAPRAMLEILFKASRKRQVPLVLVANRWIQTPAYKLIRSVQVESGMDVADDWIVAHAQPGDVVVSNDVPLAAEAVEKGAVVLRSRGEVLDAHNVRQRLAMRDFMEEMRAGGVHTGGPPPYGAKDRQSFANALDRLLTKRLNR